MCPMTLAHNLGLKIPKTMIVIGYLGLMHAYPDRLRDECFQMIKMTTWKD